MKRYKQYKPTGISWLPEIPAHWEEKRLATRFHGRVEANSDFEFKRAFKFNYGSVVPKNEVGAPVEYRDVYVKYSKVLQNDILINGLNLNYDFVSQRVAIVPEPGIVTSAYVVLRPFETTYAPYFCYLLKSMDSQKLFHGMGTGIRLTLSFDELKKQLIPIPSIEEQRRIVAYLDKKTTLIETCKCKRERELQTLNELKQAEIASVVTRGLNPNVPMKDSGIPWIGQIPAHWDTMRIRGLFSESEEKTEDESGTLLSLSQYTGITLKSEAGKTGMFEAESTVGYKVVHPGQFVMNIMLAWNGSYAVSELEGIISPAYCVFDFRIDCNKKYYDYLLRTKAYCGAFKTQSRGIIDSRLRLYPYKFYAFRTLVPPIEEQDAIVAYIYSKVSKIDAMIDALKLEIERLTEYKQRLISDVVTGQVDVRSEIIG